MSNWTAQRLSDDQITYAATDAYMPLLLYYKLRAVEATLITADYTLEKSATKSLEVAADIQHILLQDRIDYLVDCCRKISKSERITLAQSENCCSICKQKFKTPSALEDHRRNSHTPVECEVCGRKKVCLCVFNSSLSTIVDNIILCSQTQVNY